MSASPSDRCVERLKREVKIIRASPPEFVAAAPDESNILLWYYVINGPKGTPYEGGKYIGKVKFPNDYPFAPPSIMMTTPNGRFKTETRLCLSISDFHPKEWNPVWNCGTILTGLLSFMVADDITHGSIETSSDYKRELAKKSHRFNIQLPQYEKLFPEAFAESKAIVLAEEASTSKVRAPSSDAMSSSGPTPVWRERLASLVQGATCVGVICAAYAIFSTYQTNML
eukprot:CAMPEP_0176407460 /NCGR_PEP_ID=MMETSP0127-20121128/1423_1 /TAXON_ID=938130 /ORGANISM="Platyophrya macrostoma, Strain WH" /LENGTH=226 /DNA_ID=CAMNT_0017786667 /DNA_START=25 /DNA_END=705 /DNA_ORIENTATION=-